MITTLSLEQRNIFDNVKKGYNVEVDASAGTGKSTLILNISRETPDKNILQLTYNSSLRKDVKESAELIVRVSFINVSLLASNSTNNGF